MPTAVPEEDHYWDLFESTQKCHYPGFVEHLLNQKHPRTELGRVVSIDYQSGQQPEINYLDSSELLRDHFKIVSDRRLLILEGLPRAFIKVIGSQLNVPPGFFSAHWVGLNDFSGTLLNRTPRSYDYMSRFHLSFPKLHWVDIEQRPEDEHEPVYIMDSSIQRPISRLSTFGDADGPWTSQEHVSFWTPNGTKGSNDSWIALIIVDPPLDYHVNWINSPLPRGVDHRPKEWLLKCPRQLCQKGSWYPLYQFHTHSSSTSQEQLRAKQQPEMLSLLDDMVLLCDDEEQGTKKGPYSSSNVCRRLVLWAWTAHLRILEAQVLWERAEMNFGPQNTNNGGVERNRRDGRELMSLSWARPWKAADFGRLVRGSMKLKTTEAELRQNMDALGIFSDSKECPHDAWEIDAWRNLQEAIQLFTFRVDRTLETYMQAVSVRQSIRSGQLTVMATLFLPVSLVAAILSMGGSFAAGESYFWVFWAVAIISTSLGLLLLFTRAGKKAFQRLSLEDSVV